MTRTIAVLFAAALGLVALEATAEEAPEAVFERGTAALQKGEYGAAIDQLESLADRGFVHPDASFDRGVAYVMRVRAHADHPGDLGRAAAAFEETLLLRPDDKDADLALDLVRAEVTRRRSHRAKDAVDVRPTLDRMIVGLASETTWDIAALVASLLFAAGLVLRARADRRAHVAGSVIAPVALVGLVALTPLAWGARELRVKTRPGVVVVAEAFLDDEDGHPVGGEPIPEAAAVECGQRRGSLVHVRWGATQGWVNAGNLRMLGPPFD